MDILLAEILWSKGGKAVFAIQCTDWLLSSFLFIVSGYTVYFISDKNDLLSLLLLLLLCLIDLVFRSPLIALQTSQGKGEGPSFVLYRKAIKLRLFLWILRTTLYMVAFLPSVFLFSLADHLVALAATEAMSTVLALVCRVISMVFLAGAVFFVEIFMLRYWPVWCILATSSSLKGALAAGKVLARGENSLLFSLYMRFGLFKPKFFKECAILVAAKAQSMKHMHILNQNAKTVKGSEKRPEKHFKTRRDKTMNNQNNQNQKNQQNNQNNQNQKNQQNNQNNQNQKNDQNRKQF